MSIFLRVKRLKDEDFQNTLGSLLLRAVRGCDSLFVKKLSRNDRDWAQLPNKHQGGFYVPKIQRDSGFFPALSNKLGRGDKPPIREVKFPTDWPQLDLQGHQSRLVNYTSKGEETHITGVPKPAFRELGPASYVLMFAKRDAAYRYECITVDANSDEALYLEQLLDLPAEFEAGVFDISEVIEQHDNLIDQTIGELFAAIQAGTLAAYLAAIPSMPTTLELANEARAAYLQDEGLKCLNPFEMDAPGDVIRHISRTLEWELFKRHQARTVAVSLAKVLLGDTDGIPDAKEFLRRVMRRTEQMDAVFLSASQQRKSRAGYSFEHHIEHMLKVGNVPHSKQVILPSKRRPDFVLPSYTYFKAQVDRSGAALVLSAKTTLRERWKQVSLEATGQDLFLATVDEKIASNAIIGMAEEGISLVVPEKLLKSKVTVYGQHSNVISFRSFFRDEIGAKRRKVWPD